MSNCNCVKIVNWSDSIGSKLDKIIDQLCEIKVELAKKEDKE